MILQEGVKIFCKLIIYCISFTMALRNHVKEQIMWDNKAQGDKKGLAICKQCSGQNSCLTVPCPG